MLQRSIHKNGYILASLYIFALQFFMNGISMNGPLWQFQGMLLPINFDKWEILWNGFKTDLNSTFSICQNVLCRELPTDSRFLQVTHQKFPPSSSLDSDKIEFTLNRFTAANVYQIQNTVLGVQIVIQKKKDSSLPDKDKKVSPVNNVLHSLFESVTLKINDQVTVTATTTF